MTLRPDTLAMTAMLALLTAIGPLSTDMYLPSLPSIAVALDTTPARAQLTLSAFLFGFAAGQVFYGPISDRHGRKPVLLFGLGLFIAASIACALATSIEMLTAARFAQALGASGPIVLGRAIVRDLYEGPRAGRELSRMGTIMGLVPAVAPVIGGVLQTLFGWPASFVATALVGIGIAAAVVLAMPETIRQRRTEAISPLSIVTGYGALLRVKPYRVHVALAALTYGGLFAFISGSSFVLQQVYRLSEIQFGFMFALMVVGFIAGTLIAQRLVVRVGLDRTIGVGVACLAAGGLAMVGCVALGIGGPFGLTVPMGLYACGVGLVLPQAQASAMMPFADRAGAASSFLGICQMTLAAFVGIGVGHALDGSALGGDGVVKSALPLALAIAALGIAAFGLFHATARIRRRS